MAYISENDVEQAAIKQFQSLGYTYSGHFDADPDGGKPERASYGDCILRQRLHMAATRLNPDMSPDVITSAVKQILSSESQQLLEENRRLHRLMVDGVPIEYRDDDGLLRGDMLRLIDFEVPDNNDWLVLNQFTVVEGDKNRRPDLVIFVNGMPLAVLELKNAAAKTADIETGFHQLQTYKQQISGLFRTNFLLVVSDGLHARYGSLSADWDRFMRWRTADGVAISGPNALEQNVLIEGLFGKETFLQMLRGFTVFGVAKTGLVKIIAGYHQFYAVQKAVKKTLIAAADDGDRRIGVIWHTTGSGKSYLMAFYAGQLVALPELQNPTIVVVTDRVDLDQQLYGTFSLCQDLLRQHPVQARDRDDLQRLLSRQSGGIILANIQKFSADEGGEHYPMLTERKNVLVIADEAHRSQYGFQARQRSDGSLAYGFAANIRDALPNASFIGFTGTPIETRDKSTPAVFGDVIDIYDISRAVDDGATVPIYYESRLARIDISDDQKPIIDAAVEEIYEDVDTVAKASVEALVGAKKRLELIAADLVPHFERRQEALIGKAMVVTMSRAICVRLYNEIIALRPDWHSEDDKKGRLKIVMSGSASDPVEWQGHIGTHTRRDIIAKRAIDPDDELLMIIVCDMWLTGFDAPPIHTMYLDKPLRGHNLMQAIARVNRVFRDKPSGLIVDFIGIAQNLKTALKDYTEADQGRAGVNESEAVAVLMEKLDIVRDIFYQFDYQTAIKSGPADRLKCLPSAMNWVLDYQHQLAVKAKSEAEARRAEYVYQDAVAALNSAYALAAASDKAAEIRDEVGFFQTVKSALTKASTAQSGSTGAKQLAVQQIIDQSVGSTEIVEILKVAGLDTPEISILSDQFLVELKGMKHKNLAVQALRKLLSDEICLRQRTNVVEFKRFSDRLAEAIARYHNNAITTVELLQELIDLSHEMVEARKRGDNQGLSDAEIAFYDALSTNKSAVECMGDVALLQIASQLANKLKNNVTVDWARRESARAIMRRDIRRILKEFGYPPDFAPNAVQTVMQQVEALSQELVKLKF